MLARPPRGPVRNQTKNPRLPPSEFDSAHGEHPPCSGSPPHRCFTDRSRQRRVWSSSSSSTPAPAPSRSGPWAIHAGPTSLSCCMVCGRLVRASPSPWCSSAASSGISSLVDRHALGVEDDQAGVGGWPGVLGLPRASGIRFLTTGTQRRVVVSSVPAYPHPPGSHHTRLASSCHPRLCPHVTAPLSSCHSVPAPHCGGGILTSSPRLRAARLQGLVASCAPVHRVASSSSLLARRHIAASPPRHRRVVASSPAVLPSSSRNSEAGEGFGCCVRAAGHEGTSCCSERRGTSAARLSRHLDLQRL